MFYVGYDQSNFHFWYESMSLRVSSLHFTLGNHYFMISDPDLIIIHVCYFHLKQFNQYNFMISVPHMRIYNTLIPLIFKHDT